MKTIGKQIRHSRPLQIAAVLLIAVATIAASSANYRLGWLQVGAGGAEGVQSSSYRFSSLTAGQGIAGKTASQSYAFAAGYQQDFSPAQPTNTPAVTDCPNPFVDVNGNVFYTAIHYLSCRHVVNGTDGTHYTPAGTSTRAQFAKVVVLGFSIQSYTPSGGTQSFTDVPNTFFAYTYIEAGFHAGVLSGFDASNCAAIGATFPCYGPNRPITRAQLTKLVVNAANYPAFTPSSGQTFSDVGPSNVFFAYIETAHYKGVINGYPDNTFHPNKNILRDEMAQIVYKGITTP